MHKTIHDVENSTIVQIYDKKMRYKWILDNVALQFASTKEVQSQLKFREKYLEVVGQPIAKVSTPEWMDFSLKAFNNNSQPNEQELIELFISRLAAFCINTRSDSKMAIFDDQAYWTSACVIFTLTGILHHLENDEEFEHCTNNWYFKVMKEEFSVRETSYRVGQYKCAVFRINMYSNKLPFNFIETLRCVQ